MAQIIPQRMAAEIDGPFVVFLIGMRINKFWKINKWLPVFQAMPAMLDELVANPDSGLLGFRYQPGFPNFSVVQYWRSFEHLHTYARDRSGKHYPAWAAFNRKVGTNGDVGIWHETYCVADGQYEAVYGNMPAYGLGLAGKLVPAAGRKNTAKGRLKQSQGEDAPIDTAGVEKVEEAAA